MFDSILSGPLGDVAGHSHRTARLARLMAVEIGTDPSVARLAALLHEGAPSRASGHDLAHRLTATAGFVIRLGLDSKVADAIRFHREHRDGSGPFGLSRRRIPAAAGIVGVAHSFDAITGGDPARSYAAFEFLENRRLFDQRMVRALRRVLSSAAPPRSLDGERGPSGRASDAKVPVRHGMGKAAR